MTTSTKTPVLIPPVMSREIVTRLHSWDWWGLDNLLPDPDRVLNAHNLPLAAYRRLLDDAHVWACFQSRKAGTLGREWEILEAKTGSIPANRQARDLIAAIMTELDVNQIISDILDAPFFGITPLEVIWKSEANRWIPRDVIGRPPEWFAFDPDGQPRFLSRDHMIDGELLPPYKLLLARHGANYQNPYGERLLARCFWPVTFKKAGFKNWAVFMEKFGMPWVVGKVPPQTTDEERSAVLAALTNMVQDSTAVINDDESIDMQDSPYKSSSQGVYDGLIKTCNSEISKAVLGQTLTTEITGQGSYAAGRTHQEVRQDLLDMDRHLTASIFNTLFAWITNLNIPDARPPLFAWYEEEDLQKERAERDQILSRIPGGPRFTRTYWLRTYNLEDTDLTKE